MGHSAVLLSYLLFVQILRALSWQLLTTVATAHILFDMNIKIEFGLLCPRNLWLQRQPNHLFDYLSMAMITLWGIIVNFSIIKKVAVLSSSLAHMPLRVFVFWFSYCENWDVENRGPCFLHVLLKSLLFASCLFHISRLSHVARELIWR